MTTYSLDVSSDYTVHCTTISTIATDTALKMCYTSVEQTYKWTNNHLLSGCMRLKMIDMDVDG